MRVSGRCGTCGEELHDAQLVRIGDRLFHASKTGCKGFRIGRRTTAEVVDVLAAQVFGPRPKRRNENGG